MANFIARSPKYATVELTKVASRKTGEIEAQCRLSEKDFEETLADGTKITALENGAIVYIDAAKDEIVKTKTADCVNAMYLHFSNPRRYEDGRSGMENFRYELNEDNNEYKEEGLYPRLFKLTSGDLFRTDYDLSGVEGIKEVTGGVLAGVTTMPNGKPGKLYRVL